MLYKVLTDYQSKLKICRQISSKLDDESELGLYNIRTQFYLNTKRKEQEFWEGKLKGLALEISANVARVKQKADRRYTRIKERFSQQGQIVQNKYEELEKKMQQMFKQMQQENKVNFESLNKKHEKNNEFYNEKFEELEKNLDIY